MDSVSLCVGIDVSKHTLDIATLPGKERWRVANDEQGISALLTRLRQRTPVHVVLEASGGYHHAVAAALAAAGLPVSVINPAWARAFAKAQGGLAKTDRIDAATLALYAERIRPPVRALPDEAARALEGLLARRRQLIDMLTAEQNRQQTAATTVRPRVEAHIAWLEAELAATDKELQQRIRTSPLWRDKDQLLQSVPGVGPVVSLTLLANLPELGQLTRQQIGALAGLAPWDCESGLWKGTLHIRGGRATVRTALFMAALTGIRWNAVLRQFYARLLAAGKPKKVAITACAHKLLTILNAILKHRIAWSPAHAAA